MGRTSTRFEARERSYPELAAHLRSQLDLVEPSIDGTISYFPCMVQMTNGQIIDRVYIIDAQSYIDHWGVWPDQDPGKSEVRLADVIEIRESPTRLPAPIADQVYRAGESHMGGSIFTIRFRDGSEKAYATGNAVDFVSLPAGKVANDILAVVPHSGRDEALAQGEPYSWCIHGSGKPNAA